MMGGVFDLLSEGYPGLVNRYRIDSAALELVVVGEVGGGGGQFPQPVLVRLIIVTGNTESGGQFGEDGQV